MAFGTAPVISTSRTQLANASKATVQTKGGQSVITMRAANGVGDNQILQMIADAHARGDATAAQINA